MDDEEEQKGEYGFGIGKNPFQYKGFQEQKQEQVIELGQRLKAKLAQAPMLKQFLQTASAQTDISRILGNMASNRKQRVQPTNAKGGFDNLVRRLIYVGIDLSKLDIAAQIKEIIDLAYKQRRGKFFYSIATIKGLAKQNPTEARPYTSRALKLVKIYNTIQNAYNLINKNPTSISNQYIIQRGQYNANMKKTIKYKLRNLIKKQENYKTLDDAKIKTALQTKLNVNRDRIIQKVSDNLANSKILVVDKVAEEAVKGQKDMSRYIELQASLL